LWNCEQLATERKNLATQSDELQGLMAKAETGAAGTMVSEVAYGPDYSRVRGKAHFVDEAWRENKCTAPAAAPVAK